jgi:hypothetical protein
MCLVLLMLAILAARANAAPVLGPDALDALDALDEPHAGGDGDEVRAETSPDLPDTPETDFDAIATDGPIGAETTSWDTSLAGSEEQLEALARGKRPSRWGRLDLSLAWRRSWDDPASSPATRHDELWLVATWRR